MFVENEGYKNVGPGIDIQHMSAFMKRYGDVYQFWNNTRDYYVRPNSPIVVYQGVARDRLIYVKDTKLSMPVELRPFPNSIGNLNIAWFINKERSLVYVCVAYAEDSMEEIGFVTNTDNISRLASSNRHIVWG
jgi:hypothetical protein